MNPHDLDQLTDRERRQFGARVNYFNSKEYFAHKRKAKIMTAITKIEQEIEDGCTTESKDVV